MSKMRYNIGDGSVYTRKNGKEYDVHLGTFGDCTRKGTTQLCAFHGKKHCFKVECRVPGENTVMFVERKPK